MCSPLHDHHADLRFMTDPCTKCDRAGIRCARPNRDGTGTCLACSLDKETCSQPRRVIVDNICEQFEVLSSLVDALQVDIQSARKPSLKREAEQEADNGAKVAKKGRMMM